jgi:hypothetical protein
MCCHTNDFIEEWHTNSWASLRIKSVGRTRLRERKKGWGTFCQTAETNGKFNRTTKEKDRTRLHAKIKGKLTTKLMDDRSWDGKRTSKYAYLCQKCEVIFNVSPNFVHNNFVFNGSGLKLLTHKKI